ncbi:hypothetical protein M3Y94_00671400 [Aphelenchoides besseyi]|nr:hypothetical protein M3Y94_00671400 [Aphelenchoides besseyi]KAI6231345.1 NAD(+) kinase [Aphelenchoides besseyi]
MMQIGCNGCPLSWRSRRHQRSSALRVTIIKNGETKKIDSTIEQKFCALNSIFIAEESSVRVSYMEIQIDDGEILKQKNSGIEFSISRDLSTFPVDEFRILEVMNLMSSLGYKIEAPKEENPVDQLCDQLNSIVGPPETTKMTYCLKEPVFNSTFQTIEQRGSARKIWIKSKGTKLQLILDSSTCIPFDYGAEILIEFDAQF